MDVSEQQFYVEGAFQKAEAAAFRRTPKWRRELRLLRRDGLRKYVRCALALRRFHHSVRRMERAEGYDY